MSKLDMERSATPVRRVVHLTTGHHWNDTRILGRQAAAAIVGGWDVVIVAPAASGAPRRFVSDEGVTVVEVPGTTSRQSRFTVMAARAIRAARAIPADLYQVHDLELLPWVAWMRLLGWRVVVDLHEDFESVVSGRLRHYGFLARVASLSMRWAVIAGVKVAHAVVAADMAIREKYAPVSGTRPSVVFRNVLPMSHPLLNAPINDARYQFGTVVALGGVNAGRVAEELVRAVEALDYLPRRILLGGNHNDTETLTRVQALAGWQKVEFIGRLSQEQVHQLLASSAISVNLFADMPNNHSVRSNRFFEALAAGAAVVVPDFPIWREFVKEYGCGVVAEPHNPDSIAAALRQLLEDPALCMRHAIRGREVVMKHFTSRLDAKDLLDAYDVVAGMRPGGQPSCWHN